MITKSMTKEDIRYAYLKDADGVFELMKKVDTTEGVCVGVYSGQNNNDYLVIGGVGCSRIRVVAVAPCIANARCESFISLDDCIEYGVHIFKRYAERINKEIPHVKFICGHELSKRDVQLFTNVALYFYNEQVVGKIGSTKKYGGHSVTDADADVMRTTNGLLMMSKNNNHAGVMFANSWISDNDLKGTQYAATRIFDEAQRISDLQMSLRLHKLAMEVYGSYFER